MAKFSVTWELGRPINSDGSNRVTVEIVTGEGEFTFAHAAFEAGKMTPSFIYLDDDFGAAKLVDVTRLA